MHFVAILRHFVGITEVITLVLIWGFEGKGDILCHNFDILQAF